MRVFRIVCLLSALAVTFLTSPAAFAGKGDKPGRSLLFQSTTKAAGWDIARQRLRLQRSVLAGA